MEIQSAPEKNRLAILCLVLGIMTTFPFILGCLFRFRLGFVLDCDMAYPALILGSLLVAPILGSLSIISGIFALLNKIKKNRIIASAGILLGILGILWGIWWWSGIDQLLL